MKFKRVHCQNVRVTTGHFTLRSLYVLTLTIPDSIDDRSFYVLTLTTGHFTLRLLRVLASCAHRKQLRLAR